MSAEAQPLGPRTQSGTQHETVQNGAVRHHDLPVGRIDADESASAEPKVNGTVASRSPVAEDLGAPRQRRRVYRKVVKPTVDRVAAICLLILFAPLIAAFALGVRMRLGRGVVFRQRRIGLDGAEFTIYKFRTMAPDRRIHPDVDGDIDGPDRRTTHKSDDDPRHTSFGRLMRKYSLDELPQLVNVLIGDMSLVGPRPELVDVAIKTGIVNHPRHLVRPGLTGLWQVSPARGELIVDGLDLDLEYVATCGPLTDLRLLVLTVPAVWRRTGS